LFTDTVELYLSARKGRQHVLRVIREIVEASPKGTRTSIGTALAFLSRVMKRRCVCFVLSDFIDEGWDQALKIAMARHDVVCMRVSDPAELELPDLGLIELVDAESGEVRLVDSSSSRVRAAYRHKQAEIRASSKRRLSQLGCDLVDLETNRDYVAPLVNFMRARSKRLRAGR
jgi:uncharacterized protein (DUF58 family)